MISSGWMNPARKVVIGSMIVLVMSCLHQAAETPGMACTLPEGSLSVSIISRFDWWNYHWTKDKIKFLGKQQQAISIEKYQSASSNRGKWDEEKAGVSKFLHGPASRLDVPYIISPDRTLLASAVYTKIPQELPPLVSTHLTFIRRTDSTIIHDLHFFHYVEALTWAPSGKFVAVLLGEPVSGPLSTRFQDWLGDMVGHPNSYRTLRVRVYDLEGDLHCAQLVREQVLLGGGYLEWQSL